MNKHHSKKQYWFSIDNYVHISWKEDSLLLHNSLTGKTLQYQGEQKILNLVKKLRSPGNLLVILLKENDLEDPVVRQFLNDVRENFMGDLIDTSYSKGKPVQMMPIAAIQKDVKNLKKGVSRSVGEGIVEYLTELSLYINNECGQRCGLCAAAYKQFSCCRKEKNGNNELDIGKIETLFEQLKGCRLINLNILGGDIFKYSKLAELLSAIDPLPVQKTFYSHYLNIIGESGELKLPTAGSSFLKILVPSPIDEKKLKFAMDILVNSSLKAKFIFIIQNEKEFETAEAVISSLRIDNHDYQPFYNRKNLEFFKENIFTDKEEILGAKPKMKDIYANSAVNTLNFGRLIILNNGHIYANVNASRLGILGKDSIYDVLYKEMYHGKSWRRVRKNVEPCKHCTFEALCPPLSNYNYAIGRNNLCHRNF